MSDIAISSRSCTERHGDFSESVVFHVVFLRCPVFCLLFACFLVRLFGWVVVCCLLVLVAAFWLDGRHLSYLVLTLFSNTWE